MDHSAVGTITIAHSHGHPLHLSACSHVRYKQALSRECQRVNILPGTYTDSNFFVPFPRLHVIGVSGDPRDVIMDIGDLGLWMLALNMDELAVTGVSVVNGKSTDDGALVIFNGFPSTQIYIENCIFNGNSANRKGT